MYGCPATYAAWPVQMLGRFRERSILVGGAKLDPLGGPRQHGAGVFLRGNAVTLAPSERTAVAAGGGRPSRYPPEPGWTKGTVGTWRCERQSESGERAAGKSYAPGRRWLSPRVERAVDPGPCRLRSDQPLGFTWRP